MREQRGNLYLLTGLILGIGLGLLIAWVISPVKYVDNEPSMLSETQKNAYRQVIALAYQSSRDLIRAQMRIDLVDPGGSYQVLAAQAQRMLAENDDPDAARALALLAADLGKPQVSTGVTITDQAVAEVTSSILPENTSTAADPLTDLTSTPATAIVAITTPTLSPTPTSTLTPMPTFTPRPTATPLRVLDAPFTLLSKQEICDGSVQPGLLQIEITDAKGNPLPGVKIIIAWPDGQDTFYTGLIPEAGQGYADFLMQPDQFYSIRVEEASEPVNNLTFPTCNGGWKLTFQQGN